MTWTHPPYLVIESSTTNSNNFIAIEYILFIVFFCFFFNNYNSIWCSSVHYNEDDKSIEYLHLRHTQQPVTSAGTPPGSHSLLCHMTTTEIINFTLSL